MATFKQYETKKGKFWLYEAYLGMNKMTGKPDKVRRRGYKTKKEAQLALSRLQVDYDKNGIKKRTTKRLKKFMTCGQKHIKPLSEKPPS